MAMFLRSSIRLPPFFVGWWSFLLLVLNYLMFFALKNGLFVKVGLFMSGLDFFTVAFFIGFGFTFGSLVAPCVFDFSFNLNVPITRSEFH